MRRARALLGLVAVPILLGAFLPGAFLLGAAAVPSSTDQVAFSFRDHRITESSGLVALGGELFATTNDSGDEARVFTVDDRGETVGVSHWAGDAHDVEALAPAGGAEVWVGDTGDNRSSRDSVQVTQVAVGRGDRDSDEPVYELTYPDGAHDAETLLAGPDGRLYVVTKGFLGGSVYAAPATLSADHANRLARVADGILPLATDGAVLPDGHHVLIRGYTRAVVYTFPGFDRVGPVALPQQPQGEGLAVSADGTVYLSSEGRGSDVLRLGVSASCPGGGGICAPHASATPAPPAGAEPGTRAATATQAHRVWWPWLLAGGVVAAVVWIQVRFLRSR